MALTATRKQSIGLWSLALVLTLASAVYQRKTGPTYPIREAVEFHGRTIQYQLDRSYGGAGDHKVRIPVPDPQLTGVLEWKRYKTEDRFTQVPMGIVDEALEASLPHQPPAGKLEYRVKLFENNELVTLPKEGSTVIRFKGDVPPYVLIPHIIAMFLAMVFSFRSGLEALRPGSGSLMRLSLWTTGLLTLGGLVLGPIVQKYAFGAYWTGWPYGTDLTDNKTAIAFLGWAGALAVLRFVRQVSIARYAVIGASLIMLGVYLIPHSTRGSEIDYKKLDAEKALREKTLPEKTTIGAPTPEGAAISTPSP